MDLLQCAKDISLCVVSHNLTLCSKEKNICIKDHGHCVFNEMIKPTCVCSPCFKGEHCEEEAVSRNLWSIGIPYNELGPNGTLIKPIIMIVFGIFLVFNGILCLQTYLCKDIRRTNLGIYLIMLSIVSIFIGMIHLIIPILSMCISKPSHRNLFADLYCFQAKFVYVPLVFMYNWFIASVAIERMLVKCFTNYYDLHDSRRRSLISSLLIVIICPLTTLPGVFTVRQNQSPDLRLVKCMNFTPLGYILFITITRIHLFAFYFIYILMNIVVLAHLLRHRRRFPDGYSLLDHVCLILRKHKDFFVPYLIQALGQLPNVLMDFIMACSSASTTRVARIYLAFSVLQILPFAITFYLYIYLAPVYWLTFWESSPIGKCLMKLMQKRKPTHHHDIIDMIYLSETRF